MRLKALFQPNSIAVVGASEKPTIGRRLIASLDRFGFSGPIFPVNPNYPTVLGRRCYADIAALPEAPDVTAFCVGYERVLEPLSAAAQRGVRAAVIMTAVSQNAASPGADCRRKSKGSVATAASHSADRIAWVC
jgi:acyl-CoA synthetase (NDP forming)